VLGREEISEHVWDESFDPFSNTIEVYVNRLRRKIDESAAKPLIHTRRGAGYMLGAAAPGSAGEVTQAEDQGLEEAQVRPKEKPKAAHSRPAGPAPTPGKKLV
jgi:DNA-binding winged helix-turn-helix (wHTH) protein